jgi:hypothetical protein
VVGFIADAIDAWADKVPASMTAKTTGYSVRSISYITIRRAEDRAVTVLPRQGLAFLLFRVLLTLQQVVHLAPVADELVEQLTASLTEPVFVLCDYCPETGNRFRGVRRSVREAAVLLHERGRELLYSSRVL